MCFKIVEMNGEHMWVANGQSVVQLRVIWNAPEALIGVSRDQHSQLQLQVNIIQGDIQRYLSEKSGLNMLIESGQLGSKNTNGQNIRAS